MNSDNSLETLGTRELVDSINHSSGVARALYLGFLALTAFIIITLANTSDLDLLLLTPLTLPIFNVDVGLRGFYALVPFAYALAHINLLVTLALLSGKLTVFNQKLIFLSYESRAEHRATLHVFAPVQYLSGQHDGLLRFTLWVIVAVLLIWMPPATLLWIQLDFLAAQDLVVINAQRAALLIDVVFTYLLWRKLLRGKARSIGDVRLPGTTAPLLRGHKRSSAMLSIWLIIVLTISVFGAVIPLGSWEKKIANSYLGSGNCSPLTASDSKEKYAKFCMNPVTRWVFDGKNALGLSEKASSDCRFHILSPHLSVPMCWFAGMRALDGLDQQVLVQGRIDQHQLSEIRSRNILPSTLRAVRGLQLQNRSLNFANFTGSHFVNSDFSFAQALGAEFRSSTHTQVVFSGAKLSGAGFWTADLRGSDFKRGELQNSKFEGASFTGVSFRDADLTKANLAFTEQLGVRYHNTDVDGANFNAAILRATEFQDMKLDKVESTTASATVSRLLGNIITGELKFGTQLYTSLQATTAIDPDTYYNTLCELPFYSINSRIQHPYNLLKMRDTKAKPLLESMVESMRGGKCLVLSNSWNQLQGHRKQEIVQLLDKPDISIETLNLAAALRTP